MSEYIKREDALHELSTAPFLDDVSEAERGVARARARCVLNSIPAADVEPVVRGELRFNEQGFLECSACSRTLRMPLVSTSEMKRCYICGAHLERSGSGE